MEKKPKRDLKIKNVFQEGDQNKGSQRTEPQKTPASLIIIQDHFSKPSSLVSEQKSVPRVEQSIISNQCLSRVSINLNPTNKSPNIEKVEEHTKESRKISKFQALKDKYIKKKQLKDGNTDQLKKSEQAKQVISIKQETKIQTPKNKSESLFFENQQTIKPWNVLQETQTFKSTIKQPSEQVTLVISPISIEKDNFSNHKINMLPEMSKSSIIQKQTKYKQHFVQQNEQIDITFEKMQKLKYKTDFSSIIQKEKSIILLQSNEAKTNKLEKNLFELKGIYVDNPPLQQAKKNFKHQTTELQKTPQKAETSAFSNRTNQKEDNKIVSITPQKKKQTIQQDFLIKNPEQLCDQIFSNDLITQRTIYFLKAKLFGKIQKQNSEMGSLLKISSKNPEFSKWVRILFERFLLEQQIKQQNQEIVNQFITQFFPPLGQTLSPVFVIMLCKLSYGFFKKYQDQLVKNCILYFQILYNNRKCISDKKRELFGLFVLQNLIKCYKSNQYCKIFADIYSQFPLIVKDQMLMEFSQECSSFAFAALIHLLATKYPSKSFGKGFINNVFFIVKCFEDKGLLEEAINLLDNCTSIVGSSYYPSFRQLRSKLISKLEIKETQARKNAKGGLFGFFNQAFDMITNPKIAKDQQILAVQQTKGSPYVKRKSEGNR